MNIHVQSFQSALLRWFRNNGRKLPWRKNYDPYQVWLSEIMLQQTQMERGVVYFERWLKRFPDVVSVASATSYEILKYWEGLGYYARARNLHKAAKLMVLHYNGSIPHEYRELLNLPGIGPYTASAIASIAFNQDVVVVDANVERVFARIFDIDSPLKSRGVHEQITALARDLLPPGDARNFNQAVMELGGIVCTPKNPDCGNCPVAGQCHAYLGDFVEDRPLKKKPQKLIRIEMATALLVKNGHIFIQQRLDDDIWGGLWEFPGGRLKDGELPEEAVLREYEEETSFKVEICRKITEITHYYTKYKVILHCYLCRLPGESLLPNLQAAQKYHWVTSDHLGNYGFPAGHRKFIEYMRIVSPDLLAREC
ncbi:A/G-specific adenine glycosylase [Desulfopila inferna]|uniref:A/G-specific adenine glycosylase n=1 Tax=Desulfopila inferna TaxID=468528 RepID=UPI001964D7FC|nr:A/G-specific adenine glycosylase [Desulfopila inferna]MBM9603251.1 A/G-specific adenine glycosylase [Desulfopila inferna]